MCIYSPVLLFSWCGPWTAAVLTIHHSILHQFLHARFHPSHNKPVAPITSTPRRTQQPTVSEEVPDQAQEETGIANYGQWGPILGQGAGGTVRLVRRYKDSRLVAVKEFRSVRQGEDERSYRRKVLFEVLLGAGIRHRNVIQMLDLFSSTSPVSQRKHYWIGMEYAPLDLFSIVMSGHMCRRELYCLFRQIVDGVDHLHSHGLAHRDLKLDNCAVTCQNVVKLIDFGTAATFDHPTAGSPHKLVGKIRGVVGSDPYLAPEVLGGQPYDARLSDVWSLGIIFLSMVLRRFPWRIADPRKDRSFQVYVQAYQKTPAQTHEEEPESALAHQLSSSRDNTLLAPVDRDDASCTSSVQQRLPPAGPQDLPKCTHDSAAPTPVRASPGNLPSPASTLHSGSKRVHTPQPGGPLSTPLQGRSVSSTAPTSATPSSTLLTNTPLFEHIGMFHGTSAASSPSSSLAAPKHVSKPEVGALQSTTGAAPARRATAETDAEGHHHQAETKSNQPIDGTSGAAGPPLPTIIEPSGNLVAGYGSPGTAEFPVAHNPGTSCGRRSLADDYTTHKSEGSPSTALSQSAPATKASAPSVARSETTYQTGSPKSIFRLIPRETRSALMRMMAVDPAQRSTLHQLLRGPEATEVFQPLFIPTSLHQAQEVLHTPPSAPTNDYNIARMGSSETTLSHRMNEVSDQGDLWLRSITTCAMLVECEQAGCSIASLRPDHPHVQPVAQDESRRQAMLAPYNGASS